MASERCRKREDVRLGHRSKDAVSKPFLETGLGKLPPEIRKMIFINLLATPPPYAGHDFAINSAGPKNSASVPKNFVHIKASWHQVTQTCRQIYLESYRLFFASDSYYLANPQGLTALLDYGCTTSTREWKCVLDYGCRHSSNPPLRHHTITTLCLEGLVTNGPLNKNIIDKILSDLILRSVRHTRQELEALTVKSLDTEACVRLNKLSNLKTVGLRMRVGEEMEHINFMYCASGMPTGLVEFLDQSHWLIRPQRHNDVWRIQYACFSFADYALDKNTEPIPSDRLRLEREVTDIDSRAPGLQEGDERYVEVQIQRRNSDNETGTVSQASDANTKDLSDTRAPLRLEPSDLNTTQVEELPDILEPTHEEVEIELEVPPMEMKDDLQISPLENNPGGTELEQEVLNTSEPFVRSRSQYNYDSQSNEHPDQENDHALSETASHDVSSIQSTEPSHQQAEESLVPTYSTFAWHSVLTNTDRSLKFQTDSDDEDSNFQNESRLEDQIPKSTQNKEAKAERHRRIRKRLLRQVHQPLSRFSDIPYPHIPEGMGSFHEWQELADLNNSEQTETGVRESMQSSTSEMREHGVGNPGATSQKATSMEKQPVTAFPEGFWSLFTFFQIWTILLTFCYSWLLVIFLTALSQNLHGN